MEYILPFILLPLITFSFAILTNLYREHRHYRFELKPNCLLTRNPVVFLTGPRSIFYFRKYWNAYPEVLAEHGYEVFTLHLPWQGPARLRKMNDFLRIQANLNKKYHLVCDDFTATELHPLLSASPAVASLTVPPPPQETSATAVPEQYKPHRSLDWAYRCHTWWFRQLSLPPANALGLQFPTTASWLLKKMQENGEQDFLT